MLVFREMPETGVIGVILLRYLWFRKELQWTLVKGYIIWPIGSLHPRPVDLWLNWAIPAHSLFSVRFALWSPVWTLSHCCSPFFVTSLVSEDLHGRCWTISQAFVLSSGLPEVKLASLKENDNNLSKARNKPKGELSHLVDS